MRFTTTGACGAAARCSRRNRGAPPQRGLRASCAALFLSYGFISAWLWRTWRRRWPCNWRSCRLVRNRAAVFGGFTCFICWPRWRVGLAQWPRRLAQGRCPEGGGRLTGVTRAVGDPAACRPASGRRGHLVWAARASPPARERARERSSCWTSSAAWQHAHRTSRCTTCWPHRGPPVRRPDRLDAKVVPQHALTSRAL
jgi:hypothetical protein